MNQPKLMHRPSPNFDHRTKGQAPEMLVLHYTGMKSENDAINRLTDFIRMIQVSIPQQSLSCISSDTTIEINQSRRINKLNTNTYRF